MNRGYVKTWRKSLDKGWLKNHKVWILWSYCLLKASHKDYEAIIGNQIVHLKPGQFVFGLKKASLETGLSIQQIRTALAFLISAGNLTIKSTNKFSIITVVNWGVYQGRDGHEQQANQHMPNKQPTTYKNGKNGKNKDSCPQQKIVDLYHEKLPMMAKARVWSKKRQAALRARWTSGVSNNNGLKSNDLDFWSALFDYVGRSKFLTGQAPPSEGRSKPFIADLEWIITESRFINILEGKYH